MMKTALLLAVLLQTPSVIAQCPPVGFDALKEFDIEKFVDERWYSMMQLPVVYQPENQFYCVYADYAMDASKSLRCKLLGWAFGCDDPPAISVFNSARDRSPNGTAVSVNFRGTIPDAENDPAKAKISPKFVRSPILGGTNYWVVAVGTYNELEGLEAVAASEFYQWAIITTAAPEVQGENGRCYSGGGMWFFSRDPAAPEGALAAIDGIATRLGLDTSVLKPVNQSGCDYAGGKGNFLSSISVFFGGPFF